MKKVTVNIPLQIDLDGKGDLMMELYKALDAINDEIATHEGSPQLLTNSIDKSDLDIDEDEDEDFQYGELFTYEGKYVSLHEKDNCLVIVVSPSQIDEIVDEFNLDIFENGTIGYPSAIPSDAYLLAEVVEDIVCNSELINMQGEDFGLTETFGFGFGAYHNDEGDLVQPTGSKIFYYNEYMIKDLFVELFRDGAVKLNKETIK
jgi:hypothetical protein